MASTLLTSYWKINALPFTFSLECFRPLGQNRLHRVCTPAARLRFTVGSWPLLCGGVVLTRCIMVSYWRLHKSCCVWGNQGWCRYYGHLIFTPSRSTCNWSQNGPNLSSLPSTTYQSHHPKTLQSPPHPYRWPSWQSTYWTTEACDQ